MSDEKIHPIETMRDGAELVRVLERLATAMELTEHRQSRLDDLLVGQWTNDVLFSGAILLDSSFAAHKDFRAPFAAVTISDPNGIGPLLVVSGSAGDDTYEAPGPGRWKLAKSDDRTIALTGRSLTFFASASPASPALFYATVWTKFPGLS